MAGSQSAVAQTAPPRGYVDVTLIGSGATSRVYRATDQRTGETVALKRLHRQLVRTTEALTRLKRELQSLAALNHGGITRVHDVIRWGGDPTVVMEFVPGEDLKERIVRGGPMPPDEAERLARDILDILAATHAAGIVHRDLKPQNIRITPEGKVYLLDFGSARLCAASELTATGTTVGTPEYMAPELFAGAAYDPRVDIYGLGATLFECLTGRPPHTADSLANLAWMRTQTDAPSVHSVRPDAPEALARMVDRCLARTPEERFASAALATWALDNPALEKAFALRRSSHPPCLHCHTPIPPESALCSRCRSDHPFTYAPGRAHVVISRVTDARRFLEHVITLFPERASPTHLHALTQRCAALSFGKQRYLSFIDEDEARKVADDLGAMGVGAEVELERGPLDSLGPGVVGVVGLIALLVGMRGGQGLLLPLQAALAALIPLGVGQLLSATLSVRKARKGLLSSAASKQEMWPVFTHQLGTGALVGGAVASAAGTGLGAATAGSLAVAATISAATRFPALPDAPSPEPPVGQQFRVALFPRRWKKQEPKKLQRKKVGPLAALMLLVAMVGVVPLEIATLSSMESVINRARTAATRIIQDIAKPAPTPTTEPQPSPSPAPAPSPSGTSAAVVADRAMSALWRAAMVAPPVFGLGAAALLLRRRRRVLTDGAQLYSELDLPAMHKLGERRVPLARQGEARPHAIDAILRAELGDPFVDEAVLRAADLARCLPRDAVVKLTRAVDAMREGRSPTVVAAAERSLLARCIGETDPAQHARMEFLALEGRLEMEAARAWASELEDKG
ncbi:MAG: serine/threonine-protein kinase [Myxococcota bacterium]